MRYNLPRKVRNVAVGPTVLCAEIGEKMSGAL